MPKYENAVVYKLCCDDPEITDIYVGSTCNFKVRKWNHKSNCNNENGEHFNRYVYKFIRNNGGWDAWSMILIKKYPHVADNQELLKKERKWINQLNATLNKNVPGITLELGKTEYSKQYFKEYNKLNTEHVKQRCKQYRELNKNKVTEYKKQYRKDNKEHLTEKIPCECGCMISRENLSQHRKTQKHNEYMSNK